MPTAITKRNIKAVTTLIQLFIDGKKDRIPVNNVDKAAKIGKSLNQSFFPVNISKRGNVMHT